MLLSKLSKTPNLSIMIWKINEMIDAINALYLESSKVDVATKVSTSQKEEKHASDNLLPSDVYDTKPAKKKASKE